MFRAVQGDCQWPLEMVEISTSHISPQSIVTGAIPSYIQTNQSQKIYVSNF